MALRNQYSTSGLAEKHAGTDCNSTMTEGEGNLSQQHRNISVVDILETTGLRNLDISDQYAHTAQKDF
jgi:hypothetical protein